MPCIEILPQNGLQSNYHPTIQREAAMAKRVKETTAVEENIPAEEPVEKAVAVIPEPAPIPEPIRIPSASGPTFGQRVGRFFSFLFRLILLLLLLGVVGAGLYFGLPLLYERYILPVQENTAELKQLREQQQVSEQTIADLQTRLADLETQQVQQAETLTSLDGRVTDIESQIALHTETLASLEKMQETLQSQTDAASADLTRQVKMMKGMELLSRARLYMYQSNFGLAKQDVQTARDLLASIRPNVPSVLGTELDAVLLRLDLVLTNLPDFPVAASDDLDVAWQILLGGVPKPQPTLSPTPTLELSPTPTPPATVEPTVTP